MEQQTTNSKFLQNLIEKAEEIKNAQNNKILTANHIVMAIILYFTSDNMESIVGNDEEEIAAVKNIAEANRLFDDTQGLIQALSSKRDSYIDDLLFRQNILSAKQESEKRGQQLVSADILLKCIINSPTDEINKFLNVENGEKSSLEKAAVNGENTQDNCSEKIVRQGELKGKSSSIANPKLSIKEITEKVRHLQKELVSTVFGQDNAISIFTSGYFQSELRSITDKENKKPRATFLFAGPPGVGKTFLAEKSAELLALPYKRFDMSEYADPDALMELCGTNESYRGAKEGELTGFVNKNPKCVLLFDEVEKAHINAIHLFLQILDAGRLRDTNTAKEVCFSQTLIIFTTNAGRKLYEDSVSPNLSNISRKTILNALEKDVDPKSGRGVFPAAICSRFATGNVVMFNHMEANSLRKIAENELKRSAESFENETGIKCSIDDEVFSCVLFSEGGRADARTIKSRASTLFSTELYELFRLISDRNNQFTFEDISDISISVLLPGEERVDRLFKDDNKGYILSLADEAINVCINDLISKTGYTHIVAKTVDEAIEIVKKKDVEIVLCDLYYNREPSANKSLNIEDVGSEGRTFFRYICEHTDVPLYILCNNEHIYRDEERFSLMREGARGFVDVSVKAEANKEINDILLKIHHQKSMLDLARANQAIIYETSQSVSEDGKTVDIRLFDLSLKTTVDAEDTDSILNNISKPNVKFSDVIGADSAKAELEYFVNYLKNPKKYASKGLGVPKGVLFYGPPGTGKTMLAKAVAGESDVTFISTEGNRFLKKYVGEGEEEVHNLFATARKYAPTIIFVDEIDAIAKERKGENYSDNVLTAFLAEMDGFKTDLKKPVFVLAATNFEVESGSAKSLDPAMVRRFDRSIYIDLPDKASRIKYIKTRMEKSAIFTLSEAEIDNIAVRSTGMSLAQLAGVFEFSMRIAVRENKDCIDDNIFEEAFESYNYGEKKKWDVSELRKTAYHEAGHAFLCWQSGETPSYLTIVARGNHGGYMQHGDSEMRGSYSKKMLLDRIRTSLGGRASELVFFGDEDGLTTGASGDLKTATAIAKSIICDYGMDCDTGLAVVSGNEQSNAQISHTIRAAVNRILADEMEKAKQILSDNKIAIDKIVEELMNKNHIGSKEINDIFSLYS